MCKSFHLRWNVDALKMSSAKHFSAQSESLSRFLQLSAHLAGSPCTTIKATEAVICQWVMEEGVSLPLRPGSLQLASLPWLQWAVLVSTVCPAPRDSNCPLAPLQLFQPSPPFVSQRAVTRSQRGYTPGPAPTAKWLCMHPCNYGPIENVPPPSLN